MQIHTEAPDHGLKILFKESDAHEDPDEYEGEKETAEEGERQQHSGRTQKDSEGKSFHSSNTAVPAKMYVHSVLLIPSHKIAGTGGTGYHSRRGCRSRFCLHLPQKNAPMGKRDVGRL